MKIKKVIGFLGNASLYLGIVKPRVFIKELSLKLKEYSGINYVPVMVKDGDLKYPLILDVKDYGLTRELVYAGIREREVVQEISRILKSHKISTIIDIGSNVGFFPILEGKLTHEDVKIYAIEPVSDNFRLLKINVLLNQLERKIKPLRLAVGNANRTVQIKVPLKRNWSTISDVDFNIPYHIENVNMVTLETLFSLEDIQRNNLFIRFDIEGYEYQLILGNKEFLKSLNNIIIEFELHHRILGKKRTIELLNTLKSMNFTLDSVTVIYHPHIYILPKFLRKAGEAFIKMRTKPLRFGEIDRGITFDEFIKRIKNDEYRFNPHLLLFK